MLKEKLGLCPYGVIYDEEESEKIFAQHDVEDEQLRKNNVTKDITIKESIKKPIEIKSPKEDEQLRKNNVAKDATIKESIKKPIEIKSTKEDKNTTDSFDKNKFKKTLDFVNSN